MLSLTHKSDRQKWQLQGMGQTISSVTSITMQGTYWIPTLQSYELMQLIASVCTLFACLLATCQTCSTELWRNVRALPSALCCRSDRQQVGTEAGSCIRTYGIKRMQVVYLLFDFTFEFSLTVELEETRAKTKI